MVAGRTVRAMGLAAAGVVAVTSTMTMGTTGTQATAASTTAVPGTVALGAVAPTKALHLAGARTANAPAAALPVPIGSDRRPVWLQAHGRFAPAKAYIRSYAVTYDQKRVPAGARITVGEFARRHTTLVALKVAGLRPGRTYGAHVHTKPCGAKPDDSGGHYQNRKDPHQPSTDPAYANPRNEVWLDFTTDRTGFGAALSKHEWRFRAGGARSVVIHEHKTERSPGKAGTAGARLACFSVPFERSGLHGAFIGR